MGPTPSIASSNCGTGVFPKETMKINSHITAVVDRSGSMAHLADDTIGGFNQFLDDQKAVPGAAVFSLYLFNHDVHPIVTNVPLSDVEPLTSQVYAVGGNTAYLDALGQAITDTGDYLKSLPESERPDTIVVLVMTDGQENSSREYTLGEIRELVERQEQEWKWKFLFLGANLDATTEGAKMGVSKKMSMSYAAKGSTVRESLRATSSNLANYRTSLDSVDLEYTDEQRIAAIDADPEPTPDDKT
jgi:hypothetical protein